MSAPKAKPQDEAQDGAKPVLLARPRPQRDPIVAAREIIARYPVIMARLAE